MSPDSVHFHSASIINFCQQSIFLFLWQQPSYQHPPEKTQSIIQEIGWHEGRFKWQAALLPGEGGKALQSFPPTPDSVCSQCLPRHVKPQAESRGHFSHRLQVYQHMFQIQKTPTKQTHIKTNPDLHVKSWCIIKIHRILKENVYWTNLTSVLENFKVQEIELKKVSYAYQKKTQTIENQSAMDCSYWENFNIRLVPYLLAPYLENCSRMFIMGGKNNWLFSTKQNGLFVFIA